MGRTENNRKQAERKSTHAKAGKRHLAHRPPPVNEDRLLRREAGEQQFTVPPGRRLSFDAKRGRIIVPRRRGPR